MTSPGCWRSLYLNDQSCNTVLELAIATAVSFRFSHQTRNSPVWLLTVGAPSGDKTNTIGNLRKAKSIMFVDTLVGKIVAAEGIIDL
jgi:hypothetical protein